MESEELDSALSGLKERIDGRLAEGSGISDCISEMENLMLSAMGGKRGDIGNRNRSRRKEENRKTKKKIYGITKIAEN